MLSAMVVFPVTRMFLAVVVVVIVEFNLIYKGGPASTLKSVILIKKCSSIG